MTPLAVGLAGLSPIAARRPSAGLFGRVPISHAVGYAALPICQVVAVCDPRYHLVQAFRGSWEDTWPAVAGYTHLEQMLLETRLDLLSVCTPDDTHVEVGLQAVEAGVRGLLCEAPLATSSAAARELIDVCRSAGTMLSVLHGRRFDPLFHYVRDALRVGDIGRLTELRLTYRSPRAMLFRKGCHGINLFQFLTGQPVVEVEAELEPGFDHWDRYRGDGGHHELSEPGVRAKLRFADGVKASFDLLRDQENAWRMDLFGTAGTINIVGRQARLQCRGEVIPLVPPPFEMVGPTAAIAELVVRLEHRRPFVSSAEEALHTIAVLEAMLASHRQGGQPVAPNA